MAATVAYPQPLSVDLTKRWTQCFNASWPQQTTTSPPWVQNNQMKGLPITNPNTSYWFDYSGAPSTGSYSGDVGNFFTALSNAAPPSVWCSDPTTCTQRLTSSTVTQWLCNTQWGQFTQEVALCIPAFQLQTGYWAHAVVALMDGQDGPQQRFYGIAYYETNTRALPPPPPSEAPDEV